MFICPFCRFRNEDGSLFCEQCKSDLGGVEAQAALVATPAVAAVMGAPMVVAVAEVTAAVAEEWPPPISVMPPSSPEPFEAVVVEVVPPVETVPTVAEAIVVSEPVPVPLMEATATVAAVVAAPTLTVDEMATLTAQVAETAMPVTEAPDAVVAEPAPPPPEAVAAVATAAQPLLVVIRGLKMGMEYPVYEGHNFIGRMDEKPVDIDLEDQESPERVLCSRQHALLMFENGQLMIEDLNSSNGTFVNRNRIYPGQQKALQAGDVVQVGSVQMRVKV